MSLLDRLENLAWTTLAAILAAIGSGMWWLVRRVLTDTKQIALMQAELDHREKLRAEDRAAMKEVKASVTRIENILLGRAPGSEGGE